MRFYKAVEKKTFKLNDISKSKAKPDANLVRFDNED